MRGGVAEGEQYDEHGGQRHAHDQQVSVRPGIVVGHARGDVIAQLHNAENVGVEHRHEQGTRVVVLPGFLGCARLVQEHVERLYAQQIGG